VRVTAAPRTDANVSSDQDQSLLSAPPPEFPPRSLATRWPATCLPEEELLAWLMSPPFVLERSAKQTRRVRGLKLMVAWLADQAGQTWQQRWLSSGADDAAGGWRQVPFEWLHARGHRSTYRHEALVEALPVLVSADVIRPSLRWLVGGGPARGGLLLRTLVASRDPAGFARLAAACDAAPGVSVVARGQTLYRAAMILAAKGGVLGDIVVGDLLELFDAQTEVYDNPSAGRTLFYRLLYDMGILGPTAPPTLRALRTEGQRSPEELIDRYRLNCRPVRDLLVAYLRERQPALDYNSLESLANYLGKLFWSDLERHNPGIDSLHLSVAVADAWKRRLRTVTKTVTTSAGEKTEVVVERINYRECLTPVRAFYLDLAHWAVEDPARWATWVARCPVGVEEINRRKAKRKLKSRMDSRTRERLPVLPVVVRCVAERRAATAAVLLAARQAGPGEPFMAAGLTLVRSVVEPRSGAGKVWAHDPADGRRRDLVREEDHAFWAWAVVEVLRATGVRVEELRELSHHSLIQYRLPTTGEIVPLLQILPSKTDTERLLVVSPELADVLGAIILRVSDGTGTVPLVPSYDTHERVWSAPAPLLFQRRLNTEIRVIADSMVRTLLCGALAHTGLVDPADGEPLRYTPHDFRRMFITDAVMNGLPPHIAQIIAGHRDINVTMGYKAVYPEEAVQAHLAFLARRRSLRPSDEYRTPTDDEWQEFLGHFEKRKVSIGTCGRAFSTPCIHEHACVRCPMLWPDPDQQPRLVEIRDNLTARITEAEREGWHGEVEGLKISLAGAHEKLSQIDSRTHPINVRLTARQRSLTSVTTSTATTQK
jgi:integrase